MKNFKKIMLGIQAQGKSFLSRLYVDHFTKDPNLIEDEKKFIYGPMSFWFQGTGHRNTERLLMMVTLPVKVSKEDAVPAGTYLLGLIEPVIRAFNEENRNDNKAREKAQFFVQSSGSRMLRRSGILYDEVKECFVLRMLFHVPLIGAVSVNGKGAYRAVSEVLILIDECIRTMDAKEMEAYIRTYRCQQQIRSFMKENGYCAFIANGSILPREKEGNEPMQGAVPFIAPKENEIAIEIRHSSHSCFAVQDEGAGSAADACMQGESSTAEAGAGTSVAGAAGISGESVTFIRGMGIPCGVTVITGGGYSGKSTLLDALEAGIYDHVPGDGREFVLTDESALKVYAEDGRPVSDLDLSAFFRFLPGKPLSSFSTDHASGSVSQASSILEAVGGGSKLLLIDEDKSATNFMIRDGLMRKIVKDEPIIPFTERVTELWQNRAVSTILVIGGSGEYLKLADRVILMQDYRPHMITGKVKELLETSSGAPLPETPECLEPAGWVLSRKLAVKETSQPFLFFRTVETENEKKVILDDYSADVTMLTAISSHEQLCSLTVVMERLLTDPAGSSREVLENVKLFLEDLLARGKTGSVMPETFCWFYEEIRPLDALCCINRMRGARFHKAQITCNAKFDDCSATDALKNSHVS